MADNPLHFLLQSVESMGLPEYWRACCPGLTVLQDTFRDTEVAPSSSPTTPPSLPTLSASSTTLQHTLNTRGFLSLSAASLSHLLPPALIASLAAGVELLILLGHPPSAICQYDEHWEILRLLAPLLEGITGGVGVGDIFSFYKQSSTLPTFAGPHRDKPNSGPEALRKDGSAQFNTVWVALTTASPSSSCLYFVPRDRDPGYHLPGDALSDSLPTIASWDNIAACPLEAGGVCVFSHRTVHWGSKPSLDCSPRIAMSYALGDQGFEAGEFYSHARYSPFPPLALRTALRAGQSVLYRAQSPLSKGELALNIRLWRSGSHFFSEAFRDKVNGECQWARFTAGR